MKKVTVTLDPELYDSAKAYAKAHDRTLANLMRHALRQLMKRYPARTGKGSLAKDIAKEILDTPISLDGVVGHPRASDEASPSDSA